MALEFGIVNNEAFVTFWRLEVWGRAVFRDLGKIALFRI